jgi:hypothetical protein
MADNIIYGVDISKEVTPIMVRDAIIDCFLKAHSNVLDEMRNYSDFKSEEEIIKMKQKNVKSLVESKFKEVGGDFNNPTKDTLMQVIVKLAEYASEFRDPIIIDRHFDEIMSLINKLD